MLTVLIPDGSLKSKFDQLFFDAGFPPVFPGDRALVGAFANDAFATVRVVRMRPWDMLPYVKRGMAHVAFTGQDLLCETGFSASDGVSVVDIYPFTRGSSVETRIVFATRADSLVTSVTQLTESDIVATEYPNIAAQYFQAQGVSPQIIFCHGSMEAHAAIGITGIVDNVDSGASLKANGLIERDVLMKSQPCMIAASNWSGDSEYSRLVGSLKDNIAAVLFARAHRLIKFNLVNGAGEHLDSVLKVLPEAKREEATVNHLAHDRGYSIEVVVPAKNAVRITDALRALGATAVCDEPLVGRYHE